MFSGFFFKNLGILLHLSQKVQVKLLTNKNPIRLSNEPKLAKRLQLKQSKQ